MESGMYFAVFVLGVGAIHLVWQAVGFLGKISHARKVKRVDERNHPARRGDWYMFFHLSDLTGKKEEQTSTTKVRDRTISTQNTRKRRRSGARLHLS